MDLIRYKWILTESVIVYLDGLNLIFCKLEIFENVDYVIILKCLLM